VSGGSTPGPMFAALGGRLPWEKVTIYQVDERVAPDGHPDRNLTLLERSLPGGGVVDVRPMPVTADDLEEAAARYASELPERLDLVHLGLGPDGHTASLVPGDPVLEVRDRDVALTGEYQGRRRMTLTYPALDRARRILWLVPGDDKADALARLRAGDESIPAGRVAAANALVVAVSAERKYPVEPRAPAVLAVDVGGSHVKAVLNGLDERRRFSSGPDLTAAEMVEGVLEQTADWEYVGVSIGVPGPVIDGKVVREPVNLGEGWLGFDFEKAFGKPTKVINDAAMQALGSYEGGRMLFLGLGTGLGTTLIIDGVLAPMELGHLPYRKATYEDYVGEAGLERDGRKRWQKHVLETIGHLSAALLPDYVVLGGGNARALEVIPENCRLGQNEDAFLGGFRLWIES
jgi:polyphosphate glucokinase